MQRCIAVPGAREGNRRAALPTGLACDISQRAFVDRRRDNVAPVSHDECEGRESMSTPVRSDAELARALGVGPAVVCRLKKRGMPTDTVEAAMAWRDQNLNPAMRVDRNPVKRAATDAQRLPGRPSVNEMAAVDRVERLMVAAHELLQFNLVHTIEEELRAALEAVPPYLSGHVRVNPEVMDWLCGPVIAELADAEGATQSGKVASAEECEAMGQFWLDAAAGRVRAAG